MCVAEESSGVVCKARMQAVFDLRNATTGDTLCNYDGVNRKTRFLFTTKHFWKFSSSSMCCFISYILLQSKTERKE